MVGHVKRNTLWSEVYFSGGGSILLMNDLGLDVLERVECCRGMTGVFLRFRSGFSNKAT